MGIRKDPLREPGRKAHESQRVLLVEDSRMYSTAIRFRIENDLGASVIHCQSFAALKDELSRPDNEFALAILDLNQKDAMDGEALDFVLARGMKPIVFTANSNPYTREKILSRNAVDFVVKNSPNALNQLVQSVDRMLQLGKPHVLVIDDVEANLAGLCEVVRESGFRPLHCRGAEEGLRMLDANRGIDLVLIRADLPGAAAQEFLEKMCTRLGDGAVRSIGYGRPGESGLASGFFKAGGDDFIHWPGDRAELTSRLNRLFELHAQIRQLKRMASRDYLTDLFNRRYFFDRGPTLVEQCLRQGKAVSAAILDIDHFKRLNDNYGHEIGDVVLKTIARKLRAVVGEQEHLLARLGGEEFGVIFVDMDIKTAFEFSDMLREEIAKARIVVEEEELAVTISLGLAEISGSETFDNYLNAADQYLYMAKHSGRNRVFSDYHVALSAAS